MTSTEGARARRESLEEYAAYERDHEDARFTEWLRERTGDRWREATAHRFVRELGDEDLEDDVFRRYLVQDYAFVESLVGTFGHAVGDAPSMAARSRLVDFLGTLTADENDYFERAFDALDVPQPKYENPELAAPTRAFDDLLGRASAGGYPELLAVLVPAEWVYCEWAASVADRSFSRDHLDEWVRLHAVPEFRSFVEWLRTELDREGAVASPRRQRRLAALFQRTVDLEVAFFDAAYDTERDEARIEHDDAARTDGGARGW